MLIFGSLAIQSAEPIEQRQVSGTLQQRKMLALTVNVHVRSANLAQRRCGDRTVVDSRVAPARSVEVAGENDLFIVLHFHQLANRPPKSLIEIDDEVDGCSIRARPDQIEIGPPAQAAVDRLILILDGEDSILQKRAEETLDKIVPEADQGVGLPGIGIRDLRLP